MSNWNYYLKIIGVCLITLIVTVGILLLALTGSFGTIKNYLASKLEFETTKKITGSGKLILFAKTNTAAIAGIKNIAVPFSKIELQNEDKEWITVSDVGTTTLLFDPVKNKGLGQVIGSSESLPAGNYINVRYTFGDVSAITSDSKTNSVKKPNEVLVVPTKVSISPETTSTVTISFIVKNSIFGNKNGYTFAPQAIVESHINAKVFTTSDKSVAIYTNVGSLYHISTVKTYTDGSSESTAVAISPEPQPTTPNNVAETPTFSPEQTGTPTTPSVSVSPSPTVPTSQATLSFTQIPDQYVAAGTHLVFRVSAKSSSELPVTYRAVAIPEGSSFNPLSQMFDWTPTTAGTYPVNITATDGKITSSLTVAVIVTGNTPTTTINPTVPVNPTPTPTIMPSPTPVAVTTKTYAYTWSTPRNYSASSMPHIIPFLWLAPWDRFLEVQSSDSDYQQVTQATKQKLEAMPNGHRVVFDWQLDYPLVGDPADKCTNPETNEKQDCIWWDTGLQKTTTIFDNYFNKLKQIGAPIDYVVLDIEKGLSMWNPGWSGNISSFKQSPLYAIESDPRFASVRQELLNLGLPSTISQTNSATLSELGIPSTSLLANVFQFWNSSAPDKNWNASDSYMYFNEVMGARVTNYLNQGIYNPIKKYYPGIQMSNYGSGYHSSTYQVPEFNGHPVQNYGTGSLVGTAQSPVLYGYVGNLKYQSLDGSNPYNTTPFNAFRYDLNVFRSYKLSSPSTPLDPWFAFKTFSTQEAGTDYYEESIFHSLLSGARHILYWNPSDHFSGNDDQIMENVLYEFDEVASSDRQTLVSNLIPWGDNYVITGAKMGSNSLWRFTPKLENGKTLQSTLVSQSNGTVILQVGNKKVTFNNAQIVTPSKSSSSYGYWISQTGTAGPVTSTVSFLQRTQTQLASVLGALVEVIKLII